MISAGNLKYLEENEIPYILGTRMRKDKEVREQVLTCGGRYRELHPIGVGFLFKRTFIILHFAL
jgi:hypothetical protein